MRQSLSEEDTMEKSKKTITAGALALVTSISGGVYFLEDRYVNASEQKEVNQEFRVGIELVNVKQAYRDAAADLYFEQSQLRKYPNDGALKKRVKDKEDEVGELKKDINNLKKKKRE